MINLHRPIQQITVLEMLPWVNHESISDKVLVVDDTLRVTKSDHKFDFITNGDLLDLTYSEFMELGGLNIHIESSDDSESRQLILEILTKATFDIFNMLACSVNVVMLRRMETKHRFTPSVYITTTRNYSNGQSMTIQCPLLDLKFDLHKKTYVSFDDPVFKNVMLIIERCAKDWSYMRGCWYEFMHSSDLEFFGVDLYFELNRDIKMLLDKKYPEIEYTYTEKEFFGNLTFRNVEHIISKSPVEDTITYTLLTKVIFPQGVTGDPYAEYSYVDQICKYLYFITEINKEVQ